MLRLQLKRRVTRLAPTATGLPFLGWSVYVGALRIRRGSLRRLRHRVRHAAWEARTGRRSVRSFEESVRAVCAHLASGSTLALRRKWCAQIRAPPAE